MLYFDSGEVDALLASSAPTEIEVVDEYDVTHRFEGFRSEGDCGGAGAD